MDPVTTAAIVKTGIDIFSAFGAKKGQQQANEAEMAFNAAEAQKGRDFEERMYKNRYQYTRADLEAAGYNPIMALGGPTNIPSGATASAHPRNDKAQAAALMSNSAVNAANVMKTLAEAKYINAQTDLAKGKVSVPGVYSGPLSGIVNPVKNFFSHNQNNAKDLAKAAKQRRQWELSNRNP